MSKNEMSDHDLLISLDTKVDERFRSLDERINLTFTKIIEKIAELNSKLDQKADRFEVHILEKEIGKHNDRINELDRHVDAIELRNSTSDIRKQAYLNAATWGWKTWLKIVAVISFIIGILKV